MCMYSNGILSFTFWAFLLAFACQSPQAPAHSENTSPRPDTNQTTALMAPNQAPPDSLVSPAIIKLVRAMSQGDSVKIMCYGNSITYGFDVDDLGQVARPYPKVLESLLQNHFQNPNIQVINEGHSGWTSDQAMKDGDFYLRQHQPDLMIMMFGINDVYHGYSPQYYKQRMLTLVRNTGFMEVSPMILTPTPILTHYDEALSVYLPILKVMAQSLEIGYLDINQAIRERVENRQLDWKKVLPDEVHFGDFYYSWIAEEVFTYFKGVHASYSGQKAGE